MVRRVAPAILCSLALLGCPQGVTDGGRVVVSNNNSPPGGGLQLGPSFAAALACESTGMSYTLQEASNPGFSSPLDGAVTAAGLFSAPSCGSSYVGTVMHVLGTCLTNGRSGVASVAIAEELINSITVAMMILNPGTPQACLQTANFTVPINGQAQFYALLNYTCTSFYSPTPPSPLPAACP